MADYGVGWINLTQDMD